MMRGSRGSRFVFVFLMASLLLLLLSAFGITEKPIRGAKRFQLDQTSVTSPETEAGGSEQEVQSVDPVGEAGDDDKNPELEAEGVDLPVTGNQADELSAGGESLRVWPESLSIPSLYEPDLTAYQGQANANQPLRGITVILDASRGGADIGAVWGTGSEAVMEKNILLDLAEETEKALARLGATVVMTRTTDEEFSFFRTVAKAADVALIRYGEAAAAAGYNQDLIDSLRLLMGDIIRINQNGASSGGRGLFGSIGTPPQLRIIYDIESQYTDTLFINLALANDSDNPESKGTQAYYMSEDFVAQVNNGYAVGQDAQQLAPNYSNIDSGGRAHLASLLKSSITSLEPWLQPEDGVQAGAERDMAVLRLNNYVSVSLVPGYLSNEGDREILTSDKGRATIGQAIANAVLQYYTTARPDDAS